MGPKDPEQEKKEIESLVIDFKNFLTAAESDPKVTTLMDEVVDDLLNREVLYDPIKAMNDAFPTWLENNKQTLS